jgi:hypothetical protein
MLKLALLLASSVSMFVLPVLVLTTLLPEKAGKGILASITWIVGFSNGDHKSLITKA